MWTMKYNVSVVLNDTVVISDFQQHYLVSLFLSCLYMVFLFPVGLIGNILILVVNLDHRGGMTAPDLYFVNLAVADLSLVADSLIEVFNLRRGYYERVVLCTLMNLFQQANMYSSVFFLTWMSFDRFVALTSSAGRSLPHAHLACCLIWLLACSLTAIPFTVAQAQHAGEGRFCFASMSQVLWLEVTLGFIVPFCMLAACYWRIAETLCRSQRGPAAGQWRPRRQKALRMITAAVVVFFLCWLPENMFVSIDLLRGDRLGGRLRQEYPQTAHAVRLAAFSNSCLNPLIYSFLGGTFQRKLKLFLHQKAGWTKCKHSTSGKSIRQSVACSHNQAMCNRFNLDVLPQTSIRQNGCRTAMVHTDITGR